MFADHKFAELGAITNFSFLRGAAHPDEMVLTAHALGLEAIGIADRNTLAGIVRAHVAAKEVGLRLLVGARLITRAGFEVIGYPEDRSAYGQLVKLLTLGNRRAPKGECHLDLEDILIHAEGQVFIAVPPVTPDESFASDLARLAKACPGQAYLALAFLYGRNDVSRLYELEQLAARLNLPTVATNLPTYHVPGRRVLADVVCAIREHVPVAEAGFLLAANAERHLKAPDEMARLFEGREEALARTAEIARRCTFSLEELRYEYPHETREGYATPQEALVALTTEGMKNRYPDGAPEKVQKAVAHELGLIDELGYAPYFLTVHDIVRYARSQDILCQGRGSAANSSVCYCLGITAVDPAQIDLLFERFVSAERNEPPDIDVDFEHERREEVIQYIYARYGRHRASIAATVITYRSRSAIREVGKAMGLSLDTVDALARTTWGWSSGGIPEDHVRELGLDPEDRTLFLALELTRALIGFPRHLSQHVGGFVITESDLDTVIPIGNAAMDDRTFVEWDKDDLDALGILKIDVLALGMLTCIAKAFHLLADHYDRPLSLAAVPAEDPSVYDMICRADTVGVFQIESRAQMSMLPRLKPRKFYDLVIEVAIVRPGPIQGDMVHPYLRRRDGTEKVSYPSKALEDVLGKTLGVPLFQEQAMKIAIVAAGFTPAESDRLRRAMATFRKVGIIHEFGTKLVNGMVANGYEKEFAERCFKQIEGFGEYGFPESHAASFALLVYVSCWLKHHYPDVFLAAMLNSQPLGFYAPAQLVRDARDHGVTVLPVDVNHSNWDATMEEEAPSKSYAVRLGFRQIKGFREAAGAVLMATRGSEGEGGYDSVRDLWLRAGLRKDAMEKLAHADAFRSLGLDRREALWAVRALGDEPLPLFRSAASQGAEEEVLLPRMPLGEHVAHDYARLKLSLKAHPMDFLRQACALKGHIPIEGLQVARNNSLVTLTGLVLLRQRPGTAKGVIFMTLEDETGAGNIIIWAKTFEAYRKVVLGSKLLSIRGRVQREGIVIHVIADHLEDASADLSLLTEGQVEGPQALARADEMKRPGEDPRVITARRVEARAKRAAAIIPKSRDFH